MKSKDLFSFLIILLTISVHAVTNPADVFSALKKGDYALAEVKNDRLKDTSMKKMLGYLIKSMKGESTNGFIDEPFVSEENTATEVGIITNLIKGYNCYAKNQPSSIDAYKHFSAALKSSDRIESIGLAKLSLIALLDLFKREIFIGGEQYKPYLEQFNKLKSDPTDEALLIMYKIIFYSKADTNLKVNYNYYDSVKQLDSIFKILPKNHPLYIYYYYEKGIEHKIKEQHDKSTYYFLKANSLCKNRSHLTDFKGSIAWQLSDLNLQANNINLSRFYLDKSISLANNLKDNYYDSWLYAEIYNEEQKYDFAYNCIKESIDIEYTLGAKNNTLEASILSVKNQTEKLKLDNLTSEAERKKNKYYLIASLLLLVFVAISAILIQNNTKRKQLLAETEKELQTEKLTNVLKEQELTSIDAMIEGQEKERQRIANDLHDDLGGLMTTVKWHFNALKSNSSPELYKKTDVLLDEAYQKIRSIAHSKNSGVIAKHGLLQAVREMSAKISAVKNLNIGILDHGLENRLENSLELTIFRIIQELITNIIKHAHADEVMIHLTNHDETLNIMVEDNGIGFDPNQITISKKGMGISSIDKRVEHLNGNITIESEKHKGTTIIIDIPI